MLEWLVPHSIRRSLQSLRDRNAELSRERSRLRRVALATARAAEVNRFTNDWRAPSTSADSSYLSDMDRIISRTRQLVRDEPWARSIIRAFVRNVVGTGITASVDGEDYAEAWRTWAENPIDIENRRSMASVQRWAMSELVISGEAFVALWVHNGHLVVQCYESEQLDRYKIRHGDNDVRNGVEVDRNGRPVAYWFYLDHPHDIRGLSRVGVGSMLSTETMRVPAEHVCHVMNPERVQQSHGVSWMLPILRNLRDLAEYDAAQLRAARAEASVGMVISGASNDDDDTNDADYVDGLNTLYLNEGESVTPFIPSRPGGTYDPFVRMQIQRIAAGVGISYDQITRNFDGGNYSSKRQASIEDRREFEHIQQMLVDQLCEPIRREWVSLWLRGNVGWIAEAEHAYGQSSARWQGQGWDWVDPASQGDQVERMMRLGLTTRTIEANRLGRSVIAIDEQAAADGTNRIVSEMTGAPREGRGEKTLKLADIATEAVHG